MNRREVAAGVGEADVVLAVDPGRLKCGVAVVRRGGEVLHQNVIDTTDAEAKLTELISRFAPRDIVVGDGTSSGDMVANLERWTATPVTLIDEKFTTILARAAYFRANPPRGLRRLIPVSLQTPSRPYDDFVAVILAQRFLDS